MLMACCLLFGLTGIAAAQKSDQVKPAATATDTKTKAVKPAKEIKADKDKPAAATSNGKHLKADGTPDKRYKENKDGGKNKAATGPTKKDGTLDMRYKANKEAAKNKKS